MKFLSNRLVVASEAIALPVVSLAVSLILFGLFVTAAGVDPFEAMALMYKGAFGSAFSIENTLQRAAPLILAALCTALPAQLGMVIIGGEGALVMGGLAAAAVALALPDSSSPLTVQIMMALGGMIMGGAWIGLCGALRHYRGVNETISSLLLTYIAIAILNHMVGGPMRDPASLNKPSSPPIGDANMIGTIPGMDVHWGLIFGIVFCIITYILMSRTTFGFAARIVGGNAKAAAISGLPVGQLLIITCLIGGAAAGLAGMVEIAAVHGAANEPLAAGYGYTGILVAFLARQNPMAIIPVAILLGGIDASGGLLQRRLDLPDASVLVLQGIIFVVILTSETLFGRFKIFTPREASDGSR
ncbi:ABC transporter permease [Sneathiella sp. P13V-1]|uniref:ABC transporter permease n=1 Tax=Sneathiella sp. P13V-1 TaxID=2697366 RepID=UPI00187BBA8C|nr:ABC transporter permease [Sneathiella sp. P13V-1]MBE7635273.1 ABC transporter permease [Sneathiella sp. P13V-1]